MKYFLTFLICSVLSINIIAQSLLLIQEDIDKKFHICGSTVFELTVRNISSSTLTNIQIQAFFENGIEYVPGSINSGAELNITNLAQPEFSIRDLSAGEELLLSLQCIANCDIYEAVNRGRFFVNRWKAQDSAGGTVDYLSPEYSIETGLLLFDTIPNLRKEVGSVFTRQIKLINTRLGPISSLIYENRHDPISLSSVSGQTLVQNDTFLRIAVGSQEIKKYGDGDSLLEQNEFIIIEERIEHKTCSTELINFKHEAFWGCDQTICQSRPASSQIDFVLPSKQADLIFDTKPAFPDCICDPNGAKQTFRIINNGGATAENIMFTFKASQALSGFDIGFLKNSIMISGAAQITDIQFMNLLDLPSCLSDSAYHEFKINLSNLPPGADIQLMFHLVTCKTSPPAVTTNYPYYYGFMYNSVCVPNSHKSGNNRIIDNFAMGSTLSTSLRLIPSDDPLVDKKTYQIETGIEFNEKISDKNLLLKYTLPCPFELLDTSFILNGKAPISKDISISYPLIIQLEYEPPFDKNIRQNFPVRIDCKNSCLSNLEATEVDLFSSCPFDRDIKAKMLTKLCVTASLTCSNTMYQCGPGNFSDPQYQLPCIQKKEHQDTILGYILYEDSLYRKNIGLADPDDDRFTNIGSNDFSNTKIKNFITGDSIVFEFKGKVIVDNPIMHFDSLTIVIGSDLSYSYFNSRIRIIKANSGEIFEFDYPLLDTFRSINPIPNCSKPVILIDAQGRGFKIPLTPEMMRPYFPELPAGFSFENNDSIYCISIGRISSFTAQRIAVLPIITRMALNDRRVPENYPFSCNIFVDTIRLTSLGLNWVPPKPIQNLCSDKIRFSTQVISLSANLNNYFSYEYRPLVRMDSIYITGLRGLRYSGLELALYYKKDSAINLYRLDTLPLYVKGNNLYWIPDSLLEAFVFDEAYEIHITPLANIEQCQDASGNITISVFCGSISPSMFYLEPIFSRFYESYVFSSVTTAQIQNANQSIIQTTKSIQATGPDIDWKLNLSQQVLDGYFYMSVQSRRNALRNLMISTVPSIHVDSVGPQQFKIGPFATKTNYSIDFKARILSCELDTIDIISIWTCDQLDRNQIEKCTRDTFSFIVFPTEPELELDLKQEDRLSTLCDTLPRMNIELYNADLGSAHEVYLEIELPEGILWEPSTLQYSYPKGSPFKVLPPAILSGMNTYRWNLEDLDPLLKLNGLPGINAPDYNTVLFRMNARTHCNSMTNGFIKVFTSGRNNCGILQNGVSKTGARIKIEGALENREMDLDMKQVSKSYCSDSAILEIQITSMQNLSISDSLEIILPPFISYIPLSTSVLSNHTLGEPILIHRANLQILKYPIQHIKNGEPLLFRIGITGLQNYKCSEFTIDAISFFKTQLMCKSNGEFCEVYQQSSQTNLTIKNPLAQIQISNFTVGSTLDKKRSKLDFILDIHDAHLLNDPEICLIWINDIDANQSWSSPDSILQTVNIDKSQITQDGMYAFSFEYENNILESCHYGLALVPKNCVCNYDTVYFSIDSSVQFITIDSSCFNYSTKIGPETIPSISYKWIIGSVPCDSCAQNEIHLENHSDTIQTFSFLVLEGSDSLCQNQYFYQFKIFPKTLGLKKIIEKCPEEFVSLDASDKKDFLWDGPGISNPYKSMQTFSLTDSILILLKYSDDLNCPTQDSFCLFPMIQTPFPTISKDTIIPAGSKVTLCANGGKTYSWRPKEGLGCADCPCIEVMPNVTTRYTVDIVDSLGCSHSLDVIVQVVQSPCDSTDFFLPNAFSPNGDFKNDILLIRTRQTDLQIHLVIYDRWGEKVFETFDIREGWNGQYKGVLLPPDVYGYYLEVICPGSKAYIRKGNISLIR